MADVTRAQLDASNNTKILGAGEVTKNRHSSHNSKIADYVDTKSATAELNSRDYTDSAIDGVQGGTLNVNPSDSPTPGVNNYNANEIGIYPDFSNIEVEEGEVVQFRRVGTSNVFTKFNVPFEEGVVKQDTLKESIVNIPTFGDNQATSFPNAGYLDDNGNVVSNPTLYHTNWNPVPEGATIVRTSNAGVYTIAFRNSANSFMVMLGTTNTPIFDFPIPNGAAYWAYNSSEDFLPGGSQYTTSPALVQFNAKSEVLWIGISPDQIIGSNIDKNSNNKAKYFPNAGYVGVGGVVDPNPSFGHTDKIKIPAGVTEVKITNAGIITGAYYNASGTFISYFGVNPNEAEHIFTIPAGAEMIVYNTDIKYAEGGAEYASSPARMEFPPYEYASKVENLNPNTPPLFGKIIAMYGHSVWAGYPKENNKSVWSPITKACNRMGATCANYAVPNGIIRNADFNGGAVSSGRTLLRFSNTSSPINYQNSMLDLIGTDAEPDLFVFGYDVNDIDEDVTDFNLFNPADPYNVAMPINSRNVNSFIGAYNTRLDGLRAAKPTARIAFITHFSEDAWDTSGRFKKCVDIINALAKYWGAPVLDMSRKTQWINRDGNNNILLYCPDNIHPASSPTTLSVDIMTFNVQKFLESII